MCVQTGKCVFACSAAASLSLYAINTKGEREAMKPLIQMYPEGGSAADIKRLPPDFDSTFLDSHTGMCYEYDVMSSRWKATFNCGVKLRSRQPDAVRVVRHWSCPTTRVPDETLVHKRPSPWEVMSAVTRDRYDHYAFKGLKTYTDCIMPIFSSKWGLSEKSPSFKVTVLMDSAEGIEVFEYGHILAMQFTASAKIEVYPHAMTMLRNFIKEKSSMMQTFDKLDFHSQVCTNLEPSLHKKASPIPVHSSND